MKPKPGHPRLRLERIFHEPSRLAIMSALCGAEEGLAFNELKEELDLTDGNLSRHLKALEESGAVEIEKAFVDAKPRTTVAVTDEGREAFIEYLRALEEMLARAAESVDAEPKSRAGRGLLKWPRAAEA